MTDRQPTPEYMERAAVVLADVFGIADYRPGLTRRVALALEDAATEAREEALRDAADCQPCTPENPNESARERGRFDGVMEYARAIQSLSKPETYRPSPSPPIEELVRAAERRFEEKVSEAVIAFGNLSKGQLSYEAAGIVVDLAAALSAFRQSSQAQGEKR